MPYKSLEKKREAHHRYYDKNKEWINAKKRKKYRENLEKFRKRYRDWYAKNREKESERKKKFRKQVKALFGNKCVSCGRKKKFVLHEIHWKKHPINLQYYRNHKEDFILLCWTCHRGFHFLHDICGMELEEIMEFIKEKRGII